MKIILIGIQGAGKSTQGNLLSKELNVPYLSTGHIFRMLAKEKTKLGRYIKETINAGLLIPDDKVLEIVQTYLSRPEYKKGYILDGFPRTLNQVKKFQNGVDKVIYLKIPDKEALWRLSYRKSTGRNDETIKAIRKRIDLFHKFTEPVIEYYRKKGILIDIDGTQTIEKVNRNILRGLGKQLIKNRVKEWSRKQKSIIAIVGLAGAGKSEAGNFFRRKNLPVISFGKILNDYVDEHGLKHTEKVHKRIREQWRREKGIDVFAKLNESKIRESFENSKVVVIEGMRSWEEYIYLKNKMKDITIYIVALFANKEIRYKRTASRKKRSSLYGEERDLNELINTNMGPTIAFADFCIKNNFSLEEFFDKLDEVYRQIYYRL